MKRLLLLAASVSIVSCSNSSVNKLPGDNTGDGAIGRDFGAPCVTDGDCNDNLDCTDDSCGGNNHCLHQVHAGYCAVEGKCVVVGEKAGNERPCLVCDPSYSATSFKPLDSLCPEDELTCTTAKCNLGICEQSVNDTWCVINGQCFKEGVKDPQNDCRACQPGQVKTAYSALTDGLACSSDGQSCTDDICQAGQCAHVLQKSGCWINSQCYQTGDRHPSDECRGCDPTQTTSNWSQLEGASCTDDGLSCTEDKCHLGACTHTFKTDACYIDGKCYGASQKKPDNSCNICNPSSSTMTWTVLNSGPCDDDGESCTSDLCQSGICTHTFVSSLDKCFVAGHCYDSGQANPTDSCQKCDTAKTKVAWSLLGDGEACTDDGLSCTDDKCASGSCNHPLKSGYCAINGACYADQAAVGASGCAICATSLSTATATPLDGAPCDDQDSATKGDFCLDQKCKGFTVRMWENFSTDAGTAVGKLAYIPTATSVWALGSSTKSTSMLMKLNGANAPTDVGQYGYELLDIHHQIVAGDNCVVLYFKNNSWTAMPSLSSNLCDDGSKSDWTTRSVWGTEISGGKMFYLAGDQRYSKQDSYGYWYSIYDSRIISCATNTDGDSFICTTQKDFHGSSYSPGHNIYYERLFGVLNANQSVGPVWGLNSPDGIYYCPSSTTSWSTAAPGGCGTATGNVCATATDTKRSVDLWATTANDVWAVGGEGLVFRYNGTAWSSVTIPAISSSDNFTSVYGSGDLVLFVGNRSTSNLFFLVYNKKLQRWFAPQIVDTGSKSAPRVGGKDLSDLYITGATWSYWDNEQRGLILYRAK